MKRTAPVMVEVAANGESALVTYKDPETGKDYDPQFVKQVKRVPGARFVNKTKPEGPAWRVNLDLPTMRKLRESFGDKLGLGPQIKKWGAEQVAKEQKLAGLSDANDAKLDSVGKGLAKWLRPYQRADVKFHAETNVLNTNQPRTGKTPTTIAGVIEANMEWGQHLVFAPKASLRNTWERGILHAYLLDQTGVEGESHWDRGDYLAAFEEHGADAPTVLTGSNTQEREEAIAEAVQLAKDGYAFWLVLNPYYCRMTTVRTYQGKEVTKQQILAMPPAKQEKVESEDRLLYPQLAEVEWDSITIDEFHLMGLSNPSTQGHRGVDHIAEVAQPARRYALSGTPMGGKPIKLFGALKFLNPEEFTSMWTWARHWLVINKNQYGSKIEGIMPGREEDFYNHLKPYLVRRTQKDALPGLPPKNRQDVWCEMTEAQRDQYLHFAREAEWHMEDLEAEGRLVATNVLAMYTRLKQFADAYCEVSRTGRETPEGLPELKVQHTTDSGKLEQLEEKLREENVIVDEGDEDEAKCALIFTQFNPMMDALGEFLTSKGVPHKVLPSRMANRKRDAIIKEFQEQSGDNPPRVLVFNTKGGTALTLDRAESVHVMDETWVPDDQEQAENRATPSTEAKAKARTDTGIYYYRTRGTVEEHIQRYVADKALNNRTILDLRRRMQKELADAEG